MLRPEPTVTSYECRGGTQPERHAGPVQGGRYAECDARCSAVANRAAVPLVPDCTPQERAAGSSAPKVVRRAPWISRACDAVQLVAVSFWAFLRRPSSDARLVSCSLRLMRFLCETRCSILLSLRLRRVAPFRATRCVAILDELHRPQHVHSRLTVGYGPARDGKSDDQRASPFLSEARSP